MQPVEIMTTNRVVISAPRDLQAAWDSVVSDIVGAFRRHGITFDKHAILDLAHSWPAAEEWFKRSVAETAGENFSMRFDVTRAGKLRLTLFQRRVVTAFVPVASEIAARDVSASMH